MIAYLKVAMSIEELPPDAPLPDGVANDEDKSEMSVSEPPESPKAAEGEAGWYNIYWTDDLSIFNDIYLVYHTSINLT